MEYNKLINLVKQNLQGYSNIENIDFNESTIITDFLQYWFNDGADTMAYNMANKQVNIDLNNPAYSGLIRKTKKAREKQLKQGFNYEYNRFIWLINDTVRFIYNNYNDLVNYKLIENEGSSLFGMGLGKNNLDLKQRIIKFANFEGITL